MERGNGVLGMGGLGQATADWGITVAAAAGFGLCLSLCALLILTQRWHGSITHDSTDGVQKFHKDPTPRVGGIGIAVTCALVWPVVPAELQGIWATIGIAGIPAFAAGLGEDLTKRVGVRARLLATMLAGLLFSALTGYVMNDVDLPGVDWLLSFTLGGLLFTAFAMGGVANAINIIDGFNGLAAGALLIMLGAFAWIAHKVGDGLVFGLAIGFAGLILGFFVLNFPFGRIFLGDGGAYFAGYLLACLGVLLPARNVEISAWTALLICGYPVIETLASMRRKSRREGHSVGKPDRVHFHMLAHRHYGRRIVPDRDREHLRNPATAAVTWVLPLVTGLLAAIAYDSALLSAVFFFATVTLYGQIYRIMSLNAPRLPAALARLL
ncbi:glycosyltransferase [Amaricoccus sp.]|uniref:MraY family glycosyltransferase n=1 Tax=Amaricoccus sp. TaxID=1872485 RepID=UPI001B6464FB|nr:glycosyltransferase [Amaricoccus sp.]MBP7242327.1 glycosyltransferase family 4 protein [Amaricoccus sp.]